jgi:dienelactone hydrolase
MRTHVETWVLVLSAALAAACTGVIDHPTGGIASPGGGKTDTGGSADAGAQPTPGADDVWPGGTTDGGTLVSTLDATPAPAPADGATPPPDDGGAAANPCAQNPCKNGGYCAASGVTYVCTCPDGFVGTNCETADVGAAEKQPISFPGARGGTVPGLLWLPAGWRQGSLPVVILAYGAGGNVGQGSVDAFATLLQANGIAALCFDLAGHGARAGEAQVSESNIAADIDILNWYIGDYGAGVNFIATRPELNPNRIGFIGASLGAIAGIPFVAGDPRIKAMIALDGAGGFGAYGYYILPTNLDPALTVASIHPRPVWLINALHDEVIPMQFIQALHNAAPNAQKTWLDCNHGLDGIDLNGLAQQAADFFKSGI